MAGKRLVSQSKVDGYEKQLNQACQKALDAMATNMTAKMRSYGLVANLVAASKRKQAAGAAIGAIVIPHLWDEALWRKMVAQEIDPVALDVASDAAAAAAAAFSLTSLWGMESTTDVITNQIREKAIGTGLALGTRVDAAAVADDDIVAGVSTALSTAGDIFMNVIGAMGQMAANMASQATAQQVVSLGAPTYLSATKTWNNQGDDRVRPSHEGVDDVPVNAMFSVGDSAMVGPGDPSGPDEEVIGCRCWLTYDGVVPEGSGIENEFPPDPEQNMEG